jgi:hypothetical protein
MQNSIRLSQVCFLNQTNMFCKIWSLGITWCFDREKNSPLLFRTKNRFIWYNCRWEIIDNITIPKCVCGSLASFYSINTLYFLASFTPTTPLRMWATIIGLFFTHFQVKFLRNLASEIIIFFLQIRSTTLKEGASTIQSIWYFNLRSENDF